MSYTVIDVLIDRSVRLQASPKTWMTVPMGIARSGSVSRVPFCRRRIIYFLDEATASLDEPSEAKLYRMLQQRLPLATMVSIGHRSTLVEFHDRHLTLSPEGSYHHIRDVLLGPGVEAKRVSQAG